MSAFVVGLTGGLASGKSTVLEFFRKLGVDTFSADNIVRQLMANDGLAYATIVDHFGKNILDLGSSKHIDRKKLGAIIFNTPKEKLWLEHYLHPLVRTSLLKLCQQSISPYVVVEIPLLAEAQTPFEWINRILVVDSDEETQQLRAENRSGLSKKESQHIINQQATREKRNRLADDIITNQGNLSQLEQQVKFLHQQYLKYSMSLHPLHV